jgi:hypothetical protein
MKCSKCGSRDIDFQESSGQSICVNCGTVLEENTIVSSIEFQVPLIYVYLVVFGLYSPNHCLWTFLFHRNQAIDPMLLDNTYQLPAVR